MRTQFASENYGDGLVKRPDVNINEAGSALIRKFLAGAGITIESSTGADDGTGDVKVGVTPVPGVSLIGGFLVNRASVSTITIGTGAARDSTNIKTIVVSSPLTVDITASGVNGLDTGSESADTWYVVFIIDDTTLVNSPAGLLSLSETSPTLPSGYDVFRRVGWARNNGSSDFYNFKQIGSGPTRVVRWLEDIDTILVVLTSGGATVFTDIVLTEFVPPSSTIANIFASSFVKNFIFRPDGTTLRFMLVNEGGTFVFDIDCPAQIIEYEGDSPAGQIDVSCLGYTDDLS